MCKITFFSVIYQQSWKGEFKLTLLTPSLVSPQDIETEVVVQFFKTKLVSSTLRTVVVELLYSHGF